MTKNRKDLCANCNHERWLHGDLQPSPSDWCTAPATGERAAPFQSICNCAGFVEPSQAATDSDSPRSHQPPCAACGLRPSVIDVGGPVDVDACIAPIVVALNAAGLPTRASCCGHGHRNGNIALADDRELFLFQNFEESRRVDDLLTRHLYPLTIGGEPMESTAPPARQLLCGKHPDGCWLLEGHGGDCNTYKQPKADRIGVPLQGEGKPATEHWPSVLSSLRAYAEAASQHDVALVQVKPSHIVRLLNEVRSGSGDDPTTAERNRLTRKAYAKLIDEDLAWLREQPSSLERHHIAAILEKAVEYEYGSAPQQGEGKPAKSERLEAAQRDREACPSCGHATDVHGAHGCNHVGDLGEYCLCAKCRAT